MADGVRLMLDDLARHGPAVRGQRDDQPEQPERDARRALCRPRSRASLSDPSMPGSTRINPPSPRTTMALLKTHSLCRTQTPSAT